MSRLVGGTRKQPQPHRVCRRGVRDGYLSIYLSIYLYNKRREIERSTGPPPIRLGEHAPPRPSQSVQTDNKDGIREEEEKEKSNENRDGARSDSITY